MRLAELRDAAPLPALPSLAERFRNASRIALQDGDVVVVARQEHGRGEAAHPRPEHRDPGHHHLRRELTSAARHSLVRTAAP